MTAVCGGGASQVKTGYGQTITVSADGVAAFRARAGLELPAAVIAAVAASVNFSSLFFCQAAPPADSHPTQDDLDDAVNFLDAAVAIPAIQKFTQWFLHRYWYQVCECVSV